MPIFKPPRQAHLANLAALLLGFAMACVLAEALLRIYFGRNEMFCMHEPNMRRVIQPQLPPGMLHWYPEKIQYSTNQQGMRGENYPADLRSYHILAMGGSTTHCGILDDDKTWPALVQDRLRKTLDGREVWVGNAGKDGLTTRSHVLQMRYLVPQYRVDLILLLAGINDLNFHMAKLESDSLYSDLNTQLFNVFSVVPDSLIKAVYKRWGLWKLARQARRYYEHQRDKRSHIEETFAALLEWRRQHQTGQEVETLPDLTQALEKYAANIAQIAELAKSKNIRLVMVTQPVLWHADMTAEEKESLMCGFFAPASAATNRMHYTTAALTAGMRLYNERLMQVCRELRIECIDLAAALPQNLQVFYDDCHFTEFGAELVAGVVAEYLKTRPPFRAASVRVDQ
jgi:lysophospholipase L1-like esterase